MATIYGHLEIGHLILAEAVLAIHPLDLQLGFSGPTTRNQSFYLKF